MVCYLSSKLESKPAFFLTFLALFFISLHLPALLNPRIVSCIVVIDSVPTLSCIEEVCHSVFAARAHMFEAHCSLLLNPLGIPMLAACKVIPMLVACKVDNVGYY